MSQDLEAKVILSVQADTSGASQNIDDLKTKLEDVNGSTITNPFKTFKTEIQAAISEAKRMEEQFGRSSTQFAGAATRVAELRDRFGEFNQSIDAFNPDNKLQAVVSIASGAVGAIQGVVGGMTLLGISSEDANESIAKLQGLLALSNALNSVDDIKNAFQNFGQILGITSAAASANAAATGTATVATQANAAATTQATIASRINGVSTSILTGIYRLLGITVNTTSTAFKVLKGAIIATGIGALIIIIGEAVSAFQEFSGAADRAAESQKKFNDLAVQNANEARQLIQDNLKGEEQVKLAYAKTEEEKFKIRDEYALKNQFALKDNYDKIKAIDEDAADDLAKQIKKGNNDGLVARINEKNRLQKVEDDAAKARTDKAASAADAARAKAKQESQRLQEERQKELDELAQIEAETIKKIGDSKLSERQVELNDLLIGFEEKKAKYVKYGKDVSAITQEYNIERLGIEKKYSDLLTKAVDDVTLNDFDKQRNVINAKYDALLKNAKTFREQLVVESLRAKETENVDVTQTTKKNTINAETNLINVEVANDIKPEDAAAIQIEKLQAIYDAEKLFKATKLAEELAALGTDEDAKANLKAKYQQDELSSKKELSDKIKEIDDRELEAKRANIELGQSFANAAIDLLGRNTVAGKALAIASATISTYEAAQGAYKSQMKLATPDAPVRATIAAGVAILQGLARVKAIVGVKVPTRNGGSAGGASVPQITAPQITASETSAANTPIQDVRVTNPNNQLIKAYYSDRDLQNGQQKSNFLNNLNSF